MRRFLLGPIINITREALLTVEHHATYLSGKMTFLLDFNLTEINTVF